MNVRFGLLLLLATSSARADWPEFRGPTANGLVPAAEAAKLPVKWSETENVAWKVELPGQGWATPVIQEGKVWIATAALDGTTFSVLALDEATGKVLLEKRLATCDNPEPLANKVNTYASCSPAAEKGRVYVHFGSYGTFCLDSTTFQVLWERRDLTCSHWRGPGASPILWGDRLILSFDGADQQYLVALDKATGKTLWRADRTTDFADYDAKGRPSNSGDMRKGYSTPYLTDVAGTPTIISPGAKAAWAYDARTGAELWNFTYSTHSPSSRTVVSSKLGLAFINTGLGKAEIHAVKLNPPPTGTVSESQIAWKLLKRTPKMSSPVLVNDLLFMNADGISSCVDAATGDVLWSERTNGQTTASLIATPDRIYVCDEDGKTAVFKASRTYELLAENQLDSGLMSSPAASDGSLFLRTKTHLYRIGH